MRLAILALAPLLLFADDKRGPSIAENKSVVLTAEIVTSRDEIKQLLGTDLDGYYVLAKVKLEPKTKLEIRLDDFLLRTDRNGEKSWPFVPSQIAGKGTLVISQTYEGSQVMNRQTGPVWGGIGGGPIGRMPGNGSGIGNSASQATNQTTATSARKDDVSPLEKKLGELILPEKEKSDEAASGLLYFPMEPKQKAKQLELYYQSPTGRISVRFKD